MRLEEKLPNDLAKAYKNAVYKVRDVKDINNPGATISRNSYFPTAMARRGVTIDFENSDYKEITKEEAKKLSRQGKRDRLRILVSKNLDNTDFDVIMYTPNNKIIADINRYWLDPSKTGLDEILEHAYKVYYTDEADHVIQRQKPQSATAEDGLPDEVGRAEYEPDWSSSLRYGGWRSESDKKLVAKAKYAYAADHQGGEADTGSHDSRLKLLIAKLYSNIESYKRRKEEYANRYKDDGGKADYWRNYFDQEIARAEREIERLYEERWAKRIERLRGGMSKDLAKAVLIKDLMDYNKAKYKSEEAKQAQGKYAELERRANDISERIKRLQSELADLQAQMTPELKAQDEEAYDTKLEEIGDKWLNYKEMLDDLKASYKGG